MRASLSNFGVSYLSLMGRSFKIVIIKGTQLYDPAKGAFVDLSVLDVLQIFGRAGRPGLEDSGVGFICTTQDKLDHYLDAITAQHPIESKFVFNNSCPLNVKI